VHPVAEGVPVPHHPAARDAGWDLLRCVVADVLRSQPLLATAAGPSGGAGGSVRASGATGAEDDAAVRVTALVDLARDGDSEAFGQLYDHYSTAVYRFIYYRVSSAALAEDLLSETFFRALRSMSRFQWQGKDFGAWLMTIARNLVTDHYKASRTRLETTTDDFSQHELAYDGPEDEVLTELTNEMLRDALDQLPTEQRECIVLRFLSDQSIAETAQALGRSEGAVKQLQLRAVRNLAKLVPEGLR
jgi:RNA polymerase sigma-70 factor (ECF subfamily)